MGELEGDQPHLRDRLQTPLTTDTKTTVMVIYFPNLLVSAYCCTLQGRLPCQK